MGIEYQITQTVYLPKSCTQMDLQSMEASSLADLVISSTSLVDQRINSKDNRKNRGGTPRKNVNNETFKNNNNILASFYFVWLEDFPRFMLQHIQLQTTFIVKKEPKACFSS